MRRTVSRTLSEWPCALSTAMTSTPAIFKAVTRSSASFADADRGSHAQPAQMVLAGIGVFLDFQDVLDGDQPLEAPGIVHDQEFFDAVLVEQLLGFFEGNAHRSSHQSVLGHDLGDLQVHIGFEAQVTVGDDSHQNAVFDHGQPGNPVFGSQFQHIGDLLVRFDRHRIDNHAAFRLLDLVHFLSLAFRAHVAMDDADSAFAGDADGRFRLRSRYPWPP